MKYKTKSTTTFNLGGNGCLFVDTNLDYYEGQTIIIGQIANRDLGYQKCEVSSYNLEDGKLCFLSPFKVVGSGQFSLWEINDADAFKKETWGIGKKYFLNYVYGCLAIIVFLLAVIVFAIITV